MEHLEGSHGPTPKSVPSGEIEMDLDSLDFRPLSGGLGFNSKKNNPFPTGTGTPRPSGASNANHFSHRPQSTPLPNPTAAPAPRNKEQIVQDFVQANLQRPAPSSSTVGRPGKRTTSNKSTERSGPVVKATLGQIAGAWTCDFVILTSVYVVGIQLLILMVLGQVNFHLFLMMDIKLKLLFTLMYLLCYCAYFSIFHLKSTPGGVIAQVRLTSRHSGRVTLSQTALRTALVVISIFSLGIPLIWNLPGNISETMLVKQV